MSALMDKLKKNTSNKWSAQINKSKIYGKKDMVPTQVPMMNVALSGDVDGGLTPGLTTIAGPSRHFKTLFALVMGAAYLRQYPDGVLLYYDTEFGTPPSYFDSLAIDMDRVFHTPITDIEQLKSDIMIQLQGIERGDHVCIIIDSVGNIASKKEVDDALAEKSVADMTRAKQLKSLFRMVTPHLTIKNIPLIAINHTYQTQEMYSKTVVSGGCLVGGTQIRMSDGSLKSVENIEIGDAVITIDGSQPVTHIWNPETLDDGFPECYEVEFDDGHKVICSDEHSFIIGDRWVAAKEISVGDVVSVV